MTLRPLDGFVVGVTADRRWSEQAELLRRRGATVMHGPAIRTDYLASDEALHDATLAVIRARPHYLVATTGIGIRAWFEAAQAWMLADDLHDALAGARIAARGPKAAAALGAVDLPVWHQAETERVEEIVDAFRCETLRDRVVAFQHAGGHDGVAVAALTGLGAEVVDVSVYRWQRPTDDERARQLIDATCAREVHAVTFTSAPAVDNLVTIATHHGRRDELLSAFNDDDVVAACIGPACAQAAHEAGIDRLVAPERGRLGLLVRTLTDTLQARRRIVRLASSTVVVQGRTVFVDDVAVDLPPRERAVFDRLLERKGSVVPKAAMLRSVWGDDADLHAVESSVGRLRRRLGPAGSAIRSVRGRGYWLDASDVDIAPETSLAAARATDGDSGPA